MPALRACARRNVARRIRAVFPFKEDGIDKADAHSGESVGLPSYYEWRSPWLTSASSSRKANGCGRRTRPLRPRATRRSQGYTWAQGELDRSREDRAARRDSAAGTRAPRAARRPPAATQSRPGIRFLRAGRQRGGRVPDLSPVGGASIARYERSVTSIRGARTPPTRTCLDHGASTPCVAAAAPMERMAVREYADPSSSHGAGQHAAHYVEVAREQIPAAAGALSEEIVLTDGVAESNSWRGCTSDQQGMHGASCRREPPGHSYLSTGNPLRKFGSTVRIDAALGV